MVLALPGSDPDARRRQMGRLIELYWKPIFAVLRRFKARGNEEARDLTQEFFLYLLERDIVERFDPGRSRFRTYLKAVLGYFLSDVDHRESAIKRGAGRPTLSLEGLQAFDPPAAREGADDDPQRAFDRAWVAELLDQSVDELRARLKNEGRERCLQVFELYDLAPSQGRPVPGYEEVAGRLGIKVSDVRNDLHAARKALRAIVAERVRETVSSPADFSDELRLILGE